MKGASGWLLYTFMHLESYADGLSYQPGNQSCRQLGSCGQLGFLLMVRAKLITTGGRKEQSWQILIGRKTWILFSK